jgi:hypothetical protein
VGEKQIPRVARDDKSRVWAAPFLVWLAASLPSSGASPFLRQGTREGGPYNGVEHLGGVQDGATGYSRTMAALAEGTSRRISL